MADAIRDEQVMSGRDFTQIRDTVQALCAFWRHSMPIWHSQPVEKVSGECRTRQKLAKKLSLLVVNEHFELIFDAVMCRVRIFQQAVSPAYS